MNQLDGLKYGTVLVSPPTPLRFGIMNLLTMTLYWTSQEKYCSEKKEYITLFLLR